MTSTKTMDVMVERTIAAPVNEVFDAWLDPAVPGTLWHRHEKLIFDPKVDGVWYLRTLAHGPEGTPHYGRFIEIDRPGRIQHSWMSPNTLGRESIVTVTFEKKGDGTLISLLHSGLPNDAMAKAHDNGWNSVFDKFIDIFAGGPHRR
jgi:uncharacterized protein YndB with AHSA1/START domain